LIYYISEVPYDLKIIDDCGTGVFCKQMYPRRALTGIALYLGAMVQISTEPGFWMFAIPTRVSVAWIVVTNCRYKKNTPVVKAMATTVLVKYPM